MLLARTNLDSLRAVFIILESRCSLVFRSTLCNRNIGVSFVFCLFDGTLLLVLTIALLLIVEYRTRQSKTRHDRTGLDRLFAIQPTVIIFLRLGLTTKCINLSPLSSLSSPYNCPHDALIAINLTHLSSFHYDKKC